MPRKNLSVIKLKRITLRDFEGYFMLESPGWLLAKESYAAGEIGAPLDALEAVCLANKLYMVNLEVRAMRELAPFGKDKIEKYLVLSRKDSDAAATLLIDMVGKKRALLILREVMVQTRADAGIGENDKVAKQKR